MNLDNLKKKYLVSSLYFNDSENILKDDCYNIWTMDYVYDNNINLGENKSNITLTSSYKNDYVTSSISIPGPNAGIVMVKEIMLGGTSFTIDFWMFFHVDVSSSSSYGFDNQAMFLVQWPDKSLKLYPDELVVNSSITAYIKNNISNNYFTNEAYNIISANNDKLFHIMISYNTNYSLNHSDKKNVINFYINNTNVVDASQYKEIEFLRNKVVIMFINQTWEYPMIISNFRVWDGVAVELDSNGNYILSDEISYNQDLNYDMSEARGMYTNVYDDMIINSK